MLNNHNIPLLYQYNFPYVTKILINNSISEYITKCDESNLIISSISDSNVPLYTVPYDAFQSCNIPFGTDSTFIQSNDELHNTCCIHMKILPEYYTIFNIEVDNDIVICMNDTHNNDKCIIEIEILRTMIKTKCYG